MRRWSLKIFNEASILALAFEKYRTSCLGCTQWYSSLPSGFFSSSGLGSHPYPWGLSQAPTYNNNHDDADVKYKQVPVDITFGNIQVKEITVKCCLNTSSNDGNKIIESLIVVSIDPIDNVQSTVGPQCKQVVASDTFCFTSLGDHKQLWQDGY